MSEVKKIATRVSYGNALVELAKEHDNVYVLDADLAAATQTAIFKKEFPEHHIDCGIAECTMMGIAAVFQRPGKFRLQALLQCLQPDVLLNRSAILSVIHI